MSILGKTAATVGVGAFALGLSLLGATSAQAAGSYQVIDECGFMNDRVIVTGDYTVGYGGHKEGGYTVKDDWGVADIVPNSPNPDDPERFMVAQGTFDHTPCPPPPPAPAPSESPEQTVKAPVKQTSGSTGSSTPTVQAPDAGTTSTAPDATETPEPTATVDPTPSESPIAIAATDSTTSDDGGNLIIPIGGAVLIASALGGAAYAAGKLGLFKK